jgi:hypothetical protein
MTRQVLQNSVERLPALYLLQSENISPCAINNISYAFVIVFCARFQIVNTITEPFNVEGTDGCMVRI